MKGSILSLKVLSRMHSISDLCHEIAFHSKFLHSQILNFQQSSDNVSRSCERLRYLYHDTCNVAERYISNNIDDKENNDNSNRYSKKNAYNKQRARTLEMLEARHVFVIETLADLKRESMDINVDSLLQPQIILNILLQHTFTKAKSKSFLNNVCNGAVVIDGNLNHIISSAISEAKMLGERCYVDQNPEIIFSNKDKDAIHLTCIPSSIHFSLVEMLKNAIFHTMESCANIPEKNKFLVPCIQVELKERTDMITIIIRDEGDGLPKVKLDKVIQFLENATISQLVDENVSYQPMSSPLKGLGAGLCLTKQHMELFGSLEIKSPVSKKGGTEILLHFHKDASLPFFTSY